MITLNLGVNLILTLFLIDLKQECLRCGPQTVLGLELANVMKAVYVADSGHMLHAVHTPDHSVLQAGSNIRDQPVGPIKPLSCTGPKKFDIPD